MLVFPHAAVVRIGGAGQFQDAQAAQSGRHRVFVEIHHRLAIGFLVACVEQRIQGKRIIFRRGDFFFHQGA
jgi:hypothetical protein